MIFCPMFKPLFSLDCDCKQSDGVMQIVPTGDNHIDLEVANPQVKTFSYWLQN